MRDLLLTKDEGQLRDASTRLDEARARNVTARARLQAMLHDERSRSLFESLEATRQPYVLATDKVQQLVRDKQAGAASNVLFADVLPTQDTFSAP